VLEIAGRKKGSALRGCTPKKTTAGGAIARITTPMQKNLDFFGKMVQTGPPNEKSRGIKQRKERKRPRKRGEEEKVCVRFGRRFAKFYQQHILNAWLR